MLKNLPISEILRIQMELLLKLALFIVESIVEIKTRENYVNIEKMFKDNINYFNFKKLQTFTLSRHHVLLMFLFMRLLCLFKSTLIFKKFKLSHFYQSPSFQFDIISILYDC